MTCTAWIGLGSNLGDSRAQIADALSALQSAGIQILAVSGLHETAPVGSGYSGSFVNGVAQIQTDLAPEPLLALLLQTETALGRNRKLDLNRTIDLDLLLMKSAGDWIFRELAPVLPHPRMFERSFVMEPLKELLQSDTIIGLQAHMRDRYDAQ